MRKMTLPGWAIYLAAISQAVIAVGVVGYGIWFRNIVKHQLGAKDTTIESLNTAIQTLKTQVSTLEAEKAPEISKAYFAMKDIAEEMTGAKNRLEEEVRRLKEKQEQEAAAQTKRTEMQFIAESLGSRMVGLFHAIDVFKAKVGTVLFPMTPQTSPLSDIGLMLRIGEGYNDAVECLVQEASEYMKTLKVIAEKRDGGQP